MKKLLLTLITVVLINMAAMANFNYVGDIKSHKKIDNRIEFVLSNALLNVYILGNNVVRFRYTDKDKFSKAPSYAVTETPNKNVEYTFTDKGNYFLISTEELNVEISKSPCRVSIYDKNMNLINEDSKSFRVSFDGNGVRCFKKLFDDEEFYGLGEKTGNLNKKGKSVYNVEYRSPGLHK